LLFPAYAKLAGFNDKDVKFQDLQTTQLGSTLAAGQVDAVSTFLIGRGGLEIATKKKIVTLPYGDYLRDLFGNSLITTDEIATKKSDMAKRFRDVIIKSLQYTIEHPEEAADIMIKDQKAANKAAAVGEIKLMAPYVKTSSGAIGVVEEAKVNRAIAILQGSGLIPAGLTADQVVALDLAPKA
jgi:NitT/TauT family transport system substrate-binding protein